MSLHPKPCAVLFVADVPKLARFYRDVAGMTTAHAANDHIILEADGFQLVIHALRGAESASDATSDNVFAREDSYLKL